MQYNEATNKTGLIQFYEVKTGLGLGTVSGDDEKKQEATIYANLALSKIWATIFRVSGDWIFDDSNQSDLPYATTNLVQSQAAYALPDELVSLLRVEVKNNTGDFKVIKPLSLKNIYPGVDEFHEDDAEPFYYRLVDRTIELFPAPDYGSVGGLKIHFDRGTVAFDYTDTTQTPGFISDFHYLVGVGMAYEWYSSHKAKDPAKNDLEKRWELGLKDVEHVYGSRFKAKSKRLTVAKRRYV